jgi:DedD protein
MNDGLLRRRILGAFVLVCLSVVLWPVVFSDVTGPFVDTSRQIPSSRTFTQYTVPEPQIPEDIPAVESRVIPGAATPEPVEGENRVPKVEAVPKPSLDKRGLPIAWAVQVGSFSKAKNARALKSRLLKQGYKAYTETATTDAGQTIRVFVGPMVSKQQSMQEKNKIDKAFDLKAKVIRYVP